MRDRHQLALRLRDEGATFEALGKALGVTTNRARMIYLRAKEVQEEESVGLSRRSMEILRRCQRSPNELAAMAEQDSRATLLSLIKEPNCSGPNAEQILAWLSAGNREMP